MNKFKEIKVFAALSKVLGKNKHYDIGHKSQLCSIKDIDGEISFKDVARNNMLDAFSHEEGDEYKKTQEHFQNFSLGRYQSLERTLSGLSSITNEYKDILSPSLYKMHHRDMDAISATRKAEGNRVYFQAIGAGIQYEIKNSVFYSYYEDGSKKLACELIRGKPNGICEAWNQSGILTKRTNYLKGELSGCSIVLIPNSRLVSKLEFQKNKPNGTVELYKQMSQNIAFEPQFYPFKAKLRFKPQSSPILSANVSNGRFHGVFWFNDTKTRILANFVNGSLFGSFVKENLYEIILTKFNKGLPSEQIFSVKPQQQIEPFLKIYSHESNKPECLYETDLKQILSDIDAYYKEGINPSRGSTASPYAYLSMWGCKLNKDGLPEGDVAVYSGYKNFVTKLRRNDSLLGILDQQESVSQILRGKCCSKEGVVNIEMCADLFYFEDENLFASPETIEVYDLNFRKRMDVILTAMNNLTAKNEQETSINKDSLMTFVRTF